MKHVGFSIPQPRIELMPPALEGRVLTTGPLKKSQQILAFIYNAAVNVCV